MKRPLLIIAIAYIIGIIMGVYCKLSIPFIVLAGSIEIIILLTFNRKNRSNIKAIILILITIILSSSKTIYLNNRYNSLYKNYDEKEITLIGTICSNVKTTDYRYVVEITVEGVSKNSAKYKNTKLIVDIDKNDKEIYKLKYGNKIFFTGVYKEPTGRRNYKGFNYKEYLKTKRIYGIITVENTKNITVIKESNLDIIHLQVNKLSQKLNYNINKILPEETASLAKGILLGDSSDITEELKYNFRDCNLSHMLAVSGSHLAYLMLGLNFIFNEKTLGKRKAKIVNIFMIIFFMMITNMSASVVRAGISVIMGIIASLINRKHDTYTTIAVALLITLIHNPFNIFSIGMQLSYLGTVGIVVFHSRIEERIIQKLVPEKSTSKVKEYIIKNIYVTLSANILIFPLTIYNFNNIPLNFVISNLITSPILGICIVLGLFTLVISIISIPFAKIVAIPLNLFLKLLIKITKIISKIPFANITVITPYIATIIGIYIVICMLLMNTYNREKIIKQKYFKTVLGGILIIFISTSIFSAIYTDKSLEIYFIDVGQGDSTLICTPTGKNILIDGGGSRNPEKYDVGEKVLLPYLLDRRIKKLDYIMVSHFDEDHEQGLEAVIKNIKVKNIIVSKQASSSSRYDKIMNLCREKNVRVIVAKRGGKIQIDKYIYFDILHPSDKMLDDGKGGLNANAIVAKLNYRTNDGNINSKNKQYFSILFTGDIEEDAEKELVKIYGEKLKCNILKVAHHGSKTSSTEEFLQCAKPDISLIGVGKDNTFGHPNVNVIKRLEDMNTKIYRTDLNGEIKIIINKNKIKIEELIK